MKPTILLVSGKGQYAECIFNGLAETFPITHVIMEEEPDAKQVQRRRRKKLGWVTVAGQQLFSNYMIPKLQQASKARVKELVKQNGLNFKKIPGEQVTVVSSVNSPAAIKLLQQFNPDIIIVNSTRILGKAVLQAVRGYFINIHGGIMPAYRGWAGAYWALVNNEPHLCGSTIHLIDEGVDTGAVLCQDTITVTPQDTYLTYAFLQLPKEIAMLKRVITDLAVNKVNPVAVGGLSRVYYEPTIWAYWYNAVVKKVK